MQGVLRIEQAARSAQFEKRALHLRRRLGKRRKIEESAETIGPSADSQRLDSQILTLLPCDQVSRHGRKNRPGSARPDLVRNSRRVTPSDRTSRASCSVAISGSPLMTGERRFGGQAAFRWARAASPWFARLMNQNRRAARIPRHELHMRMVREREAGIYRLQEDISGLLAHHRELSLERVDACLICSVRPSSA